MLTLMLTTLRVVSVYWSDSSPELTRWDRQAWHCGRHRSWHDLLVCGRVQEWQVRNHKERSGMNISYRVFIYLWMNGSHLFILIFRVIESLCHMLPGPLRERLFGDAVKNQATIHPENTIFDIKRLIGRKFSDQSVQADNFNIWDHLQGW